MSDAISPEEPMIYPAHNSAGLYQGVGALPLKPDDSARPVRRHLEDIKRIIVEFVKES
jgi:hypothetical protein